MLEWIEAVRFYPVSLLGTGLLGLALLLCLYSMVVSLVGVIRNDGRPIRSGENALLSSFFLLTLATVLLAVAFYRNDFTLSYVARHSSAELPRFYALTALWGGQEGSLLFWVWILSIYSLVVVLQNRQRRRIWMPWVTMTLAFVEAFFLTTIFFSANPFMPVPEAVSNGLGLNPILQNPLMALHPPNLYIGYVGFTIPFAFAVAALITGTMNHEWLVAIRRWALVPWFFLTIGILIGSRWAYEELGWGGYWGWDPVENASLMPWLLSTAYLHSIMIQEKKNMLRAWNLTLIMATFVMSILGTFITRSGILSSVHAFAVSRIGDYFIVFLSFVIFYGLAALYIRWPVIRSTRRIEAFLSKESSFLFNNLLLTGICFAVLWGTLFPLVSDLVKGHRVTVAAPFFNRVNAPIGLALLILTGVCPLIAWRRASLRNFQRNFLIPFTTTLAFATILFAVGIRKPWALAFSTASFFVLATIILEFYRGVKARKALHGEPPHIALWKLLVKHPRRYGGYIVHFGVVLIFFGIAGSAYYQIKQEASLKPGESTQLGEYTLIYEGTAQHTYPHKISTRATLRLLKDGKFITVIHPGQDFHPRAEQPVTEVAIHSTLWGDVYVVFAGLEEDQTALFEMYYNPLVSWIWAGGWMIALGGLIIMNPRWEPRFVLSPGRLGMVAK